MDQYRMQEVAYGHQGFLGGEAWHDPALSWLEPHLMRPLTAHSGAGRSRSRLTTSTAATGWTRRRRPSRTLPSACSRVRVRYSNGLMVWANSGEPHPCVSANVTLPPNGWLAAGAGLLRGDDGCVQGIVSDMADTPDSLFVNARPAEDWEMTGTTRLRPAVAEFVRDRPALVPRRLSLDRRAGTRPADYGCFVHFVQPSLGDTREGIRFQQDHILPQPTSQWKPGTTVTDGPWNSAT